MNPCENPQSTPITYDIQSDEAIGIFERTFYTNYTRRLHPERYYDTTTHRFLYTFLIPFIEESERGNFAIDFSMESISSSVYT